MQSVDFNEALVAIIFKDSQFILDDPDASIHDLQTVWLALRLLEPYLKRFAISEEVDEDKDNKENKDKDKDKEKDEEKEDHPLPPRMPDASQAKIIDTDGSKDKEQKKTIFAEYPGITPFFKLGHYNFVNRFAQMNFQVEELAGERTTVSRYKSTPDHLVLKPAGSSPQHIPQVPGFEILESPNDKIKIRKVQGGAFEVITELKSIEIPLKRDEVERLNPLALDQLVRPVGFPIDDLPPMTQSLINNMDRSRPPLEIAARVDRHFYKDFLYSRDGRPDLGHAAAAMRAGVLQCTYGALSMVGILRDHFKIPSRVAFGFRAKAKTINGKKNSVMQLPSGVAHVWVEVYHDGRWHTFDPTPEKQDKKSENLEQGLPDIPVREPGEDSEFEDGDSEDKDGEQGDESGDEKGQGKQGGKGRPKKAEKSQEGEGDQDAEDQESQERIDEIQRKAKEKAEEKKKKKKKSDNKKNETDEDSTLEDLDDSLEELGIGSLSLKSIEIANPLYARVLRTLIREAVRPEQASSLVLNRLHAIQALIRNADSPALNSLLDRAIKVNGGKKTMGIATSLREISALSTSRSLDDTYYRVHGWVQRLEVFASLLDTNGNLPFPQKILPLLKKLRGELYNRALADSSAIVAAKEFLDSLPPIAKASLKAKYGIDSPGPNAGTRKLIKELSSNLLGDYMLMAKLRSLTDFILESDPVTIFKKVRSWVPDQRYPNGRDWMPPLTFGDIHRGYLGQPHLSRFENYRRGTLWVPRVYKKVKVPSSFGTSDDKERKTLIPYDTSASMDGNPGKFQAALISTFVDNALSDMRLDGTHRHQAILMGFDHRVHTITPVRNYQEAKGLVEKFSALLVNTNGSTDIELALLTALDEILKAQEKNGEPLRKANIIIMTDGQSTIDFEKVAAARDKISRDTPIELMFIAINQTNHLLAEFAMSCSRSGFERGHYREYSERRIAQILAESQRFEIPENFDAFFTEESQVVVGQQLKPLFEQVSAEAWNFEAALRSSPKPKSLEYWQKILSQLRPTKERLDRDLEPRISHLRSMFIAHKTLQSATARRLTLEDLMENFTEVTGIEIDNLTELERASLEHLLHGR